MRNFNAVPQTQYRGSPGVMPLSYAGLSGVGVPLTFNWSLYGVSTAVPNITAVLNLNTKELTKLDAIRSVYIDNMASNVPVYLYFPDTQYSIVCAPNAAGWYKIYTGGKEFWVIGLGFLTGNIPLTYVIVTNLNIESAIDPELQTAVALWKASPSITRGTTIYNSTFGVPALGDQAVQYQNNFTAPGILQNNLWGTPYSSGFVYLTAISMILSGIGLSGNPAPGFVSLQLESIGAAGILFQPSWGATNVGAGSIQGPYGNQQILLFTGMNLKLDATQMWRIRVSDVIELNGLLQSAFIYTISD